MTLLAAPRAEAVPSVTFQCTPAPQDCSGWYRSNVSIEWTVLPSDAAKTGCENQSLTSDTPGTQVFCRASDGSAAVTVELSLKVDKTPPVVTGSQPARGADANGWYNHAVGVSFAGSDLTSGIASCTSTTYGGPDSSAASVQGTCVDHAGNVSAPLGYGLKYDETAPAVTAARPERQPNAAGWFNRAVTFDIDGTDATSGISGCAPVTYGGPDSSTASITGACQDQAGNATNRSFALKYDSTPPAVAGSQAARPADAGGWYNHSVAVSFTGADGLSGVEACTATTYSGPDAGTASVPGTCTDRAGNVSPSVGFPLRYDATKPIVTNGQPGRAADADGWYNHAVAVAFSGTDQTAGIAGCQTLTYAGPDSGTASLGGTCSDQAGNESNAFSYQLKYDATAPTVAGADPERAVNANGWFNRSVAFTIRGTDATSGVAACPGTTYSGPDSATASITGVCRDRAGNSSSRAFPLKYDATAPTATAGVPTRAADKDGWFNHPVAVAFSGTDGLSGVDSCSSASYAGPDSATASVSGTCTDDAGNVSAPLGHALKYDATAPTVTGGEPARAPNADGWYNSAVAIGFAGTDPVSGVDLCTSTSYGGPDNAAASVSGTCTDKAGNTSGSFPYGLKYDATAPTVAAADPDRAANANGWYNRSVGFTVRGTDATSGVAACPAANYSGPDNATASVTGTCRDRAGNSASRGFPLKYDATAPTATGSQAAREPGAGGWYNGPVAIAFSGTDGLSGVDSCETVTYSAPDNAAASVPGTCTDKAGNVSAPRGHALKYDATAPTVTSGTPDRAANANGWYNRAVAIGFAGTDPVSGVDSCTTTTYGGPDNAAARVSGTCIDKAGNTSGPLPFGLKYDATEPQVTAGTPQRNPNANGWYNRAVAFEFAGTDATSGVAACPSVTYTGPESATGSVVGRCTDRAGNAADRGFPLKYDATAPTATGSQAAREPGAGGWYNGPVAIAFSGTDGLSGVDSCETVTYSAPDNAAASVPGTCTDKAGNVSTPRGHALKYDATAPTVAAADPDRAANGNGWYNRAVAFTFRGTDATSGVAGCPGTSYSGPDAATASVLGRCTDNAGNSASREFALKYDATAPTATGSQAAREPDSSGWYNAPVNVAFSGTDGLSGVDTCATVTYSGPDDAAASLPGTCADKAGNVSAPRAHALKYDATGPTVAGVTPDQEPNGAGWHNRPVEFQFEGADAASGLLSCAKRAYTGPDSAAAAVTGTCTDAAGNVSAARTHPFKYDATAPVVVPGNEAGRPPDANGWYNRAVSVAFHGTDETSGIDTCTTVTYRGPDSDAAAVPGACGDKAGNVSAPASFGLKYDGTGPVVTSATAERAFDNAGWFVRPVRFDVTGTDELSLIDNCPSVTYTGPDGAGAVVASCRDKAGNVTNRSFPLKYDATAPLLTSVVAAGGDRSVSLSWQPSPDTVSVVVLRTPGLDGQARSEVYRGAGSSFVDQRVDNGVSYEYEFEVLDAAGNVGTHKVAGLPAAPQAIVQSSPPPAAGPVIVPRTTPSILPAPGTVLRTGASPLLQWPRAERANYYNVQLFRGGRKILSAWPKRAQYRLKTRWTYRGERRRLGPGRYRWMVWPGYGKRSKADFGKRLVSSTFQVKRGGAAGTQ